MASAPQADPAFLAGTVKPVTPDPATTTPSLVGKYAYLSDATVQIDANGTGIVCYELLGRERKQQHDFSERALHPQYRSRIQRRRRQRRLRSRAANHCDTRPQCGDYLESGNDHLSAGSTATATLTLTSDSDMARHCGRQCRIQPATEQYTFPLELECDGRPARATCSFSSGAVIVAPGAPGTVTMTINTNVSSGTSASLQQPTSPIAFAALFGAGLWDLSLVAGRLDGGNV